MVSTLQEAEIEEAVDLEAEYETVGPEAASAEGNPVAAEVAAVFDIWEAERECL